MRRARRARALTLEQAARLTGISASQLSRIERGRSIPSARTMARLRLLEVDISPAEPSRARRSQDRRHSALARMVEAWPFVGRDPELAMLNAALTVPGRGGLVIVGAPGVGKTGLAREALAAAESQGCVAFWLVGLQAAMHTPLAPFAHLIAAGDLAASDGDPWLQRWSDHVVALAQGRRQVLVVDDAHLLDDASATLIHHLVMTGAAFVVATVSSGQPVPDPVVALWKDGHAQRVYLRPLDFVTTQDLLRRALGGAVEILTAHAMWAGCRGNPLLLRELVIEGLESESLSTTDGVWRWSGPLVIGQRLQEVMRLREATLSAAEVDALRVLAVGERLDLRVLDRLVPEQVLVALELKGLIEVEASDSGGPTLVRLAHPLYGEALRVGSPIRARALKRRLVEAMEGAGSVLCEDLPRLAAWKLDAGDPPSREQLMGAARQAEMGFAHNLAERFAEAALQSGDAFESRLLLAQALIGQRRGKEAEEILSQLQAGATQEGTDAPRTDDERVRLARAQSTNLMTNLDRPAEAVAVIAGAEAVTADPARRAELASLRSYALAWAGRDDEALPIAQQLLHRPRLSELAKLHAALAATLVWRKKGSFGRMLEVCEEALRLAQRAWDVLPLAEVAAAGCMWWALEGTGQIGRAAALAEEHWQHALGSHLYDAAAHWVVLAAYSELLQGQVSTAARRLTEGLPLVREHDRLGDAPLGGALLAQAAALARDLTIADSALAGADQPSSQHGLAYLARAHLDLARAWIAAARGDVLAARASVLEAALVARNAGDVGLESHALHDHARLGDASEVADRLAELARQTDGRLHHLFAEHAAALRRDDGQALDQVTASFAALGLRLFAAEAAMSAAHAHRRAGVPGRARFSRRLALELAASCERAWTPALALLEDEEVEVILTSRELEIGMLAAQDLPSSAIAERLGISVRTVDNHLSRIYRKVGVRSRHQLRGLLFGGRSSSSEPT